MVSFIKLFELQITKKASDTKSSETMKFCSNTNKQLLSQLLTVLIYLCRNQKKDKFLYHFAYCNNSCCIKLTNVLFLLGESIRTRTILKHPRHGGSACPNLREIWKCARKISFFHTKYYNIGQMLQVDLL